MPLAPSSLRPLFALALLAGLLGLLGLAGCGEGAGEGERARAGASRGALGGDDVGLASRPDYPDVALARLCQMVGPGPSPGAPDGCFVPGPVPPSSLTCSAVLVGQNVLVTAAHCVCATPSSWPRSAWFGPSGYRVKGTRVHPGALCAEPSDPSQAAHDLALVWLERRVERFDARPLPLASGPSLADALRAGSLAPPVRAAGVGASSPGALSSPLGVPRSADVDPVGLSLLPDGIILARSSPGAFGLEGDSGGPLSALREGSPRLIGVLSGSVRVSLESIWAPAFDAGPDDPSLPAEQRPNGAFLREALASLDADGDGLTDDVE